LIWCLSAMVGEQPTEIIGEGIRPLIIEKFLQSSYCLTREGRALDNVPKQSSTIEFFQVLPAKLVLDWRQLNLPAILTFESFMKGYNISKKIWLQYLLHFCADRQINECLNNIRKYMKPPYVAVMYSLKPDTKDGKILKTYIRLKELAGCVKELSKEEVSLYADLSAISKFYGLEFLHQQKMSKDYILKRVLTKIAYLKLEIT